MISGEQITLAYKIGELGPAMLWVIAFITIVTGLGVTYHDYKKGKKQ